MLLLSGNLFAKERKGAEVIISTKYIHRVRGELIAVKQNSILILDSSTAADISIDVPDIKTIRIIKKKNTLLNTGLGFLAGASGGVIIGLLVHSAINKGGGSLTIWEPKHSALVGGAAGGLIGGITAYSDESGHRFRFNPATFRSEATLVFHYTSE